MEVLYFIRLFWGWGFALHEPYTAEVCGEGGD